MPVALWRTRSGVVGRKTFSMMAGKDAGNKMLTMEIIPEKHLYLLPRTAHALAISEMLPSGAMGRFDLIRSRRAVLFSSVSDIA